MPEKTEMSQGYVTLHESLRRQTSLKALMDLATSDGFIAAAGKLEKPELEQLRNDFVSFRISLSGQVKLEELSGEEVTVERAIFRHTEPEPGKPGAAYSLYGKRADGSKFQTITSSSPIVRFWDNNHERTPLQVVMTKEAHPDEKRAANGHTIWRIREQRQGSQAKVPF